MSVPACRAAVALLTLVLLPACSLKHIAVNALGNALAEGGSSYARDADPDLVWEAVPFGLKTVEGLLDEAPRHKGLLLAAASGFVQYGYGRVQQEADFEEAHDLARATELRTRARRLYLRALGYGWRGLEVDFPGLRERLHAEGAPALSRLRKEHVPLLYFTGLAWFAAISVSKDDSELTADQGQAEALMRRALELDESYDHGALHDFFISWEGRGESVGGSFARARSHLERAEALAGGRRVSAFVNFAETVSVAQQDRREFERLLREALAVDPDAAPDMRLANLVYQKRARWLLGRTDELFIE
ncbi:MAG TPA: TRAP transporter TatT component family protein [Vicinamibacteria bacterium]|nr:TRAP transporter TatT component family protein [Vicinamibacteria bacterium]